MDVNDNAGFLIVRLFNPSIANMPASTGFTSSIE
jgi:hypothetical protein